MISLQKDRTAQILVVGAGFAGAVIARELAEHLGRKILVIDSRNHVAGNCHTERDAGTGILVHNYGPHIFNTNRSDVWDYVRQFGAFESFVNRVKAVTARGVYSLPINLLTINQFYRRALDPQQARAFIAQLGDASIVEPQNFEEQALKFVGRELYETFFYGYTKKQWGCEPVALPASIFKRLPLRFDYDDRFYNSRYQGVPVEGYTSLVKRMLTHPNIEVMLETAFERSMLDEFQHTFYCGPLDAFFGFQHGRLGYRTVQWTRAEYEGDFQGNAVLNYPGLDVPHTRVHEHKHFAPWENHRKTLVFTEYSAETGPADTPYYPKRLASDVVLSRRYVEMAAEHHTVTFCGRLGTYRYMDMDQIIAESLALSHDLMRVECSAWRAPRFRFSARPETPPPAK